MKAEAAARDLHVFLGGHDLEMETIGALARDVLGADKIHDAGLAWGATASAYRDEIAAVLAAGGRPVLVELADDLPDSFPRHRLLIVDHHGACAGRDAPSSLRQVFDLLALPTAAWTRYHALVAANDIGHMRAMRALGASAAEIRAIRDADRRAQGVTDEDEAAARIGIAKARFEQGVLTVRSGSARTSPVGDFLEPEYGGPGPQALLVLSPGEANFFGPGAVVIELGKQPGSWFGGALPERGFWGCRLVAPGEGDAIARNIAGLLASSQRFDFP